MGFLIVPEILLDSEKRLLLLFLKAGSGRRPGRKAILTDREDVNNDK